MLLHVNEAALIQLKLHAGQPDLLGGMPHLEWNMKISACYVLKREVYINLEILCTFMQKKCLNFYVKKMFDFKCKKIRISRQCM